MFERLKREFVQFPLHGVFLSATAPLESTFSDHDKDCRMAASTSGVRIVLLVLGEYARADSWLPPHEFDAVSENARFIARVIPATTNSEPRLVVSSIEKAKTNEIWRAQLSNPVSPVEVYVADDEIGRAHV